MGHILLGLYHSACLPLTGLPQAGHSDSVRECLRSHCFFSLPNQRGAMNDQHSLRIHPLSGERRSSPSHPGLTITLGFSERASPQRKTKLRLERGSCQEAQKTCCSIGRSHTAPGGPSGNGPRSTPKVLLTLPPGACVRSASGEEFPPLAGEVVSLPPRGQGMFLTLCVLCLRLGLLSISFLQQIFVGCLLCPHPSSPSCQGRRACWVLSHRWE